MVTARSAVILSLLAMLVTLGAQGLPRLRTDDQVLATSITSAIERSPTFRRVVDELHATDGIVTIERGACRSKLPACLLFWLGAAGPNRVLRVVVDRRLRGDEVLVFLAHELRHAIEVLSESNVKSGSEIYFLFRRIGSWQGDVFETPAADDVEGAVRRELQRRPE